MAFQRPDLGYNLSTLLSSGSSRRTLELHLGRHHAGYLKKLNGLIDGHRMAIETPRRHRPRHLWR